MRKYEISALANADGLDDSFFSNVNGASSGGGKVSPEMIQAGAALTAGLISTMANKSKDPNKMELKSACGRKPLLNIGGKKDKYQKCVSDYLKQKAEASRPSPPPAPTYTPPVTSQRTYASDDKTKKKKFLGMPMGVGITVTVLAAAAIGFGVYKLVLKK